MYHLRSVKAPPRFRFWTRGEVVRLGVMAVACTIPLMMPESHLSKPNRGVQRAALAPSSGQVRAIRVTTFDVSAAGIGALGDSSD